MTRLAWRIDRGKPLSIARTAPDSRHGRADKLQGPITSRCCAAVLALAVERSVFKPILFRAFASYHTELSANDRLQITACGR